MPRDISECYFRFKNKEFNKYILHYFETKGDDNVTDDMEYIFKFENGYGASIVKGRWESAGSNLWTLNILKFSDQNKSWVPICVEELGGVTFKKCSDKKVEEILSKIQNLERSK